MAPPSLFARRVLMLVAGTAGAQAIGLLAAPVLTRLYTPEDFGLLAVFGALLAIMALMASLRYELAIPIAEDEAEAAHLVVLGLLIAIAVAAFTGGILLLFGGAIATQLNVTALTRYLWLLPLGVLFAAVYQVFNYWAIRAKSFKTIANTKWSQALATVGLQLSAYQLGAVALLAGQLAGQGTGGGRLAFSALCHPTFRQIAWRGIRNAAHRYRRFPIFSTWAGLMNTASAQLPAVLFAGIFGPAAAGLYLLTYRVLVMPSSLVGGAVGNVFFSHATDARRNGEMASLVHSVYDKLIKMGLGPTLLVMIAGPRLFELVFGENWRVGGELAQWMAPWILLSFVYSPLSAIFDVMEKQALEAALQGSLLVARIAAITTGAMQGDVVFTIALFSCASVAVYLASLAAVVRLSGNSLASAMGPLLSGLGWGMVTTVPVLAASLFLPEGLPWMAALALSTAMMGYHYKLVYQHEMRRKTLA